MSIKVFEDLFCIVGVEAAKAAGAKCITATNSTAAEKLSQADMICDSLKEINIGIIKSLARLAKTN